MNAETRRVQWLKKWKKRQDLKIKCLEYLGGKCKHCDYSKCLGALEFHHRDPATKVFSISRGITHLYKWERLKTELDKTDLACSNCHREEHWNMFNDVNITLSEELGMMNPVEGHVAEGT